MKGQINRVAPLVATGAAWMVGLRWSIRLLGVVSTMILARLLVPSDFGLVAIASTMVAVIEILGDFGFDTYLIRHQDADRKEYDTAWTLNALRGLVVAGIVILAAPAAARFFNEPRQQGVLPWLAIAEVAFGFQNIGIVEFRKKLQFHKEFCFQAATRLVAVFVTIGFAVTLRSY